MTSNGKTEETFRYIKVYFSGREAVIHLIRRNENWQVLREDSPTEHYHASLWVGIKHPTSRKSTYHHSVTFPGILYLL